VALIFDRRAQLGSTPGCHALIMGVSRYEHLPEPNEPPGAFGLSRLASPALTGFRIAAWLQAQKDALSAPLATCRVLLAPSAAEVAVEPALAGWPHRCTFDEAAQAASDWRDDCVSSPEGLAFFFFSGHGVQRTLDDSVLLLEDFGKLAANPMRQTVSVNNIFAGMAPNSSGDKVARRQVYFIDACRLFPEDLKNADVMHAGQFFEPQLGGGRDDRAAPIFFGAIPDSKAYSRIGQTSVFGTALLACLALAAEPREDTNGALVYEVGSEALEDCLTKYFEALTVEEKSDQDILPGVGLPKNVTIHRLAKAPDIPVSIKLIPPASFGKVGFTIESDDGVVWEHVREAPPPEAAVETVLPMGTYRMKVTETPERGLTYVKTRPVGPPRFIWRVHAP
jgi:hypothetical protein